MTSPPPGSTITQDEVLRALSGLDSLRDRSTTWAVVLATDDPLRVVWANKAATLLFETADPGLIQAQVFAGRGRGGLAEALRRLPVDAPPRLERLRLIKGFRSRSLTILVSRSRLAGGGAVYLLSVPGPEAGDGVEDWSASALHMSEVSVPVDGTRDLLPGPAIHGDRQSETALPVPEMIDVGATPVESLQPGSRPGFSAAASRRMLWETDADHRILRFAGLVPDLLGPEHNIVGRSLPDLLTEIGSDPDQQIAAVLASRRTWSGLSLLWPVLEGGHRVTVTLGAVPVVDAAKQFSGFRGYAVADLSRLPPVLAQAGRSNPDAAVASAGDAVLEQQPVLVGAADMVPVSKVTDPFDEGKPGEPTPELPAVSIGRVEQPAQEQRTFSDQDADTNSEAGPLRRSPSQSSKVVALRPFGPGHVYPVSFPVPRAGSLEAGGAATPSGHESDGPDPDASQSNDLSIGERTAFHEIGRALVARFEGSKREEGPPRADAGDAAIVPTQDLRPGDIGPKAAASAGLDSAQVLDHVPTALSVFEGDAPIYANRAFLSLTGHPSVDALVALGGAASLLGDSGARLLHGGSPQLLSIVDASGHGIRVDGRSERLRQDGRDLDLLVLTPATDGGAPMKPADFASQEDRNTDDAAVGGMLEMIPEAAAVVDAAGLVLAFSRSGERLFARDRDDVAGQPISRLLAPDSHAAVMEAVATLATNPDRGTQTSLDVTGRRADGDLMPLDMTARRIAPDRVCLAWIDRRSRTADDNLADVRHELDQAKSVKSDFLAKISHEIRTPLNAILGFAEVILDERFGPIGNVRYRDYLRDIHDSGVHVMSLVNDLLDLSKIEAGRLDMTPVAVDVNRVVGECVGQMQAGAHRERVILRTSLVQRLPAALVDERALRQVMANILSNAVNFNEPGGQVIVSTAINDAGEIAVRVRDTGIGMSEREIAEAMEPFRQITTAKLRGGNGLGLPLTKALVEANHATLVIKSRKNEGTLVEVALRAAGASAEPFRVPAE